jgi:hypothetical protein
LAIFLVLGISLMIVAPLLRRYHKASAALTAGASIVLGLAIVGLMHSDPRIGQAAIEANRRSYMAMLLEVFQVGLLAGMGNQRSVCPVSGNNSRLAGILLALVTSNYRFNRDLSKLLRWARIN